MDDEPSADDLALFLLLDERRYLAERQARAATQACATIKQRLHAYCAQHGGAAELHGYSLRFVNGGTQVPWQRLVADRLGLQAVLDAQRDTPPTQRLVIAELDRRST
jgi:hypothetical protein